MPKNISSTQKVLNLWAIILIIWSIYRTKFSLPEWFDEFITKPLVFIFPVYLYIKNIEKKDFFTGIQLNLKSLSKDFYLGLLAGLIFLGSVLFVNYYKYNTLVVFSKTNFSLKVILLSLLIAIATGISEEILSRGFVLKRLYEESKNVFSSIFLASILFFFIHIPILFKNTHLTGNLLLIVMLTDMALSFITSYIFLQRKSLVSPILIHAFYNFSMIFLIQGLS